ncbi:hypothetical protein G6F37_000288 [Rhizopus arrhizus]|nr:hypothetical protein G6F38_004737 [Rhizopus arrhizus]KAG1164452.1 hypothetical protein G6F37_000288 [Rhizopus arrhizus]
MLGKKSHDNEQEIAKIFVEEDGSCSSNETTPLIAQQKQPHHKRRELVGLLYMTLSALGFSSMSLFVKLSGTSFPSFEIVFARSSIQALFGLLCCALLKINPLGEKGVRKWLFFRGLAGTIGISLFFFSITQLPLADATVVFFLGPAFTAILAAIVLGEAFTLFDGICSVICLIGVILVSKPQFLFGQTDESNNTQATSDWIRLFAIFCALLGAFMSAVAYVIVRKVGRGVHFMVHVVSFGSISTVGSLIGMFAFQEPIMPRSGYEISMLLLVGVSAFIGQCFLNQGLQMAPAGPGSTKDRTAVRMIEETKKSDILIPEARTIIESAFGNASIRAGIIRIPTEATWDAPEPHIGVARKLRDETLYADIFYQYDKSAAGARTNGIITGIAQKRKEKLPNIKVVDIDPVVSHSLIREESLLCSGSSGAAINLTQLCFAGVIVHDLNLTEYVAIDTEMECKKVIGLVKDNSLDQLLVTTRPHHRLRRLIAIGNILSYMASNHATLSTSVFYDMFYFSRGSREFKDITKCTPTDKLTCFFKTNSSALTTDSSIVKHAVTKFDLL